MNYMLFTGKTGYSTNNDTTYKVHEETEPSQRRKNQQIPTGRGVRLIFEPLNRRLNVQVVRFLLKIFQIGFIRGFSKASAQIRIRHRSEFCFWFCLSLCIICQCIKIIRLFTEIHTLDHNVNENQYELKIKQGERKVPMSRQRYSVD